MFLHKFDKSKLNYLNYIKYNLNNLFVIPIL